MRKIAMRCTQEQFDDIKEKLKGIKITDTFFNLKKYQYLTNYYNFEPGIGSVDTGYAHKRENYEQWDKNIFLEACGIETKPTLEEVKEYFKDARIVKCAYTKKEYDITKDIVGDIRDDYKEFWIKACSTDINLWDEKTGYAEIIKRKQPKYKITKETILKYKMKDEFPEMFEVKLEVGKIYSYNDCVLCFQGKKNGLLTAYGFRKDKYWMDLCTFGNSPEKWNEYNPRVFETALINEAKKRGFKEGVYFDNSTLKDNDFGKGNQIKGNVWFSKSDGGTIWCDSNEGYNRQLFRKGIWAEIIQTITKEEAEKKLNCKIV